MEQRSGRISGAAKCFALWIGLSLCLVSFCTPKPAAAVTMGSVGDTDQPGTCDEKNDVCSLTVPIGGYTVPPGNPSEYGMCGIIGLSGNLTRAKDARIIIVGNQYRVNLQWTGGGAIPPISLKYTCAHLTEFSGLPAASKFAVNQPMPVVSSNSPYVSSRQIAGEPDACIWTGLALAVTRFDVKTEVESGGNRTVATAQILNTKGSLSTYAFCYTFSGKSSAWKYNQIGPLAVSPPTSRRLPATQNNFWCFMVGVYAYEPSGFDANLFIDHTVHPAVYATLLTGDAGLYWNCLPFSQ